MKVLAFDIGIKNLAWALIDRESTPYKVLGLANENIMELSDSEISVTAGRGEVLGSKCEHQTCRSKGGWETSKGHFCKRHLPENIQTLDDILPTGTNVRNLTISILKELLNADEKKEMKTNKIKQSKDAIQIILSRRIAFPIKPPKTKRTSSLNPEQLHDAIRNFVRKRMDIFCQADRILIENQPAFKNPHMKTVQILLFSSIREAFYGRIIQVPPCILVHAKKKAGGIDIQKGDAGYAERKARSEERVAELYADGNLSGFYELFSGAKKKSDMADAICMCCDFQSVTSAATATRVHAHSSANNVLT